jgi:uncharacterized membrane protein
MRANKAWKSISQIFFKGLFLLLPLLLSLYFLIWLVETFDGLFKRLLHPFIASNEIPFGVGVFLGIILIFAIGISTKFLFTQFLESWVEKIFRKIPIVGTVFTSLKDIAEYVKSMRNPNAHGKISDYNIPQHRP